MSFDRWHDVLEKVSQFTNKIGMPMDEGIVEAVAIMQFIGFHTTMSCEGHVGRHTGGPYIMFMSPVAEKLRKQAAALDSRSSLQYKTLYRKAMRANITEQQKIYHLLDTFYKNRHTPFSQRLIIHTMGFSAFRLECQGSNITYMLSRPQQKTLLENNRAELQTFAQYVRTVYQF